MQVAHYTEPDKEDLNLQFQYKVVDGGRWQSREQSEAERAQNSDLPSVRVGGLRPDTEYEARVAVYDDYSIRSLGKSTGVIEFRTEREFTYIDSN